VFLDKNNYIDLEVLVQMRCEMVIKLHAKGGRASGKTAGNVAGKPIYEHF
jgi:hypothetical protein